MIQDIHDECLIRTQRIIDNLGWLDINVSSITDDDAFLLLQGIPGMRLNWKWGMQTYAGYPKDGILDIKLKIASRNDPDGLHAVIICKYDEQSDEFGIGMLENFLAREKTVLNGKVLLIAFIYSTVFCPRLNLDEFFIYDPDTALIPKYESYGFSLLQVNSRKMKAKVADVMAIALRKANELPPDN
ncbi:hypothetical protein NB704_004165 [Pantoea ananatis]|nr:hypothetical protein [Pantoea ananatis]